jgi:hypothetical protein
MQAILLLCWSYLSLNLKAVTHQLTRRCQIISPLCNLIIIIFGSATIWTVLLVFITSWFCLLLSCLPLQDTIFDSDGQLQVIHILLTQQHQVIPASDLLLQQPLNILSRDAHHLHELVASLQLLGLVVSLLLVEVKLLLLQLWARSFSLRVHQR